MATAFPNERWGTIRQAPQGLANVILDGRRDIVAILCMQLHVLLIADNKLIPGIANVPFLLPFLKVGQSMHQGEHNLGHGCDCCLGVLFSVTATREPLKLWYTVDLCQCAPERVQAVWGEGLRC